MNELNETDKLLIQASYDRFHMSTLSDNFKMADLLDLRSSLFKIYLHDWLSSAGRKAIWDMIWVLNNSWYERNYQLREADEQARVI